MSVELTSCTTADVCYLYCLQCTPEQISSDLHDELMYQLEHDDNLQKVSLLSSSAVAALHRTKLREIPECIKI